ncbi:MAG: amino acid permease [Flavipsychrobacter sp.]|jgi:amino acid transporter|nr:amino acid permease [Flavipsychrobacter sp.]
MKQDLFRKKTLGHINKEVAEGLIEGHSTNMKKVLSVRDLTFMGIAAIVGAGIFSTIGKASFDGGPGIILLFLFVAIACGFSAICYAEFASMVPVSGSAYTYSYVAFGELIAWIIGWDLLMEYAIGNIAVAISWSDYFCSLVNSIHIGNFHPHIPEYLSTDYWSAKDGLNEEAKLAWAKAPTFGGLKIICDLPAFLITVVITWIIYIGIKESQKSTNVMVILKIAIILLVMIAGCFYVNTANWTPFLPNGISGVLMGTSAVFFSYIGFDAISTTAEECKDPQRDLPKAMFNSLIICTVVYVLVALVLTGMTSYKNLNVGDPLAYVFSIMNSKYANYIAGVISISAVIATASVLLVFQLGQPRIWMSMSRDGLLPPIFAKIHPKYKTPSFSTILTGVVVGVPALFMNLSVVVNLTSVGTLFAFVLVCGGILKLQNDPERLQSRFKTPYVNGKWIVLLLLTVFIVLFQTYYPGGFGGYLNFADEKGEVTWAVIRTKVPFFLFGITFLVTTILTFIRNYSLIPVLGFLACSYLLSESGVTNWERFAVWLILGLILYFVYGYKHSKIGKGVS